MKNIKILMILAHLWDMNKYTVKKNKKNFLRETCMRSWMYKENTYMLN